MKVRYFEGWARHIASAQPWVKTVRTLAEAGVNKPVGLVLEPHAGPTVAVQFVRAASSTPNQIETPDEWTPDGSTVEPVQAAPKDPKGWAVALAEAIRTAGHPEVKAAETYDEWGKSSKPAGIRVEFTDGAEIFGSFLDRR